MEQNKTKAKEPITVVVGLGRSGIAAAKLLNKEGKKVVVIEKSTKEKYKNTCKDLTQLGIVVELGKPLEISSFEPWIENISSVIVSPSIPWDHKTINQLRGLKIEVKAEISLAWERLNYIPWIGITGTNGKTTVTEMLKHIMDTNRINYECGGNIGRPATEIALNHSNNKNNIPDWLIIELSSYQIESEEDISPRIGIWTTFTADHLERHKTMENYFKIKKRLLDNSSIRIYNLDDTNLKAQKEFLKDGLWVSAESKTFSNYFPNFFINKEGMVCSKEQILFNSSILKIPGKHNLQNLLMVTAAAIKVGLSPKQIEKSLSSFKGIPHRLEYIGKIESIKFFNDSKATNYDSASIALKALSCKTIVLAGGEAKKGDPTDWIMQLKKRSCAIFLFGSSAIELQKLINNSDYKEPISIHKDLKEALSSAIKMGLKIHALNILLSPACSSFDQYIDFEARGNHFKKLFKEFKSIQERKKTHDFIE